MDPNNRHEFERLVVEAVDELPSEFLSKLENISVTIQDLATPQQLEKVKQSQPLNLFGLYEGIPIPYRRNYAGVLPDKITIFRLPILLRFQTPEAIRRKIKSVVLHELGHHFGLSDERLYRSKKAR